MALHKNFPKSPYEILDPSIRWFPGYIYHNYRGRWVYFDRTSKDFKDNSFDNWTDLEI